jgi:hypothetical protein
VYIEGWLQLRDVRLRKMDDSVIVEIRRTKRLRKGLITLVVLLNLLAAAIIAQK